MRQNIISKVVNILTLENIAPEYISPNTVNYYANKYNIEITSDEVVYINDNCEELMN